MKKLIFTLTAALVCQTAVAQNQPVFVQTVCLKVDLAKASQYESFVRDTVAKGMRTMVESGDVLWFVFSRNVVPAGEAATCDYVGSTATRGFPSAPAQSRLAQAIEKAGVNMTAEEYVAKLSSLRRQVSSGMLVTVGGVGEIAEGDYYRVNQMKIKPGMAAAWRELELKIWAPVQEERIKAGGLKAWRSYSRFLPGGSGHLYDALTVDVYTSWAAQGQPTGLADALKKVHPNMKQPEFNEKTSAPRDLVNSELRQAIIVMGNTKM